MDEHHKWHAHFPVTPERLAAYVSFFDVASSGTKYVQALKKANSLLGVCWLEESYVSELLRGSAKFSLPTHKSYFVGKYTGVITKELCQRGYISLARLCAVCYTFQLRAQSEAFGLEVGVKRLSNGGDDWHSEVILDGAKATIKLRRRKNTNYQTNLVRYCICKVWEPLCICGVCALRQAIRVMKAPHGQIFDGLRTTMISVIKDIAQDNGLGRATWHGFRRGRTMDVLQGLDMKTNPAASLAEIYESGGWRPGSSAFFHYLPPKELNAQRCARQVMENSDTD